MVLFFYEMIIHFYYLQNILFDKIKIQLNFLNICMLCFLKFFSKTLRALNVGEEWVEKKTGKTYCLSSYSEPFLLKKIKAFNFEHVISLKIHLFYYVI